MSIGANIRYYRERANMTLEELTKHVGVSRQTLSRYETGVIGNIPSDKIEQIAQALHTTPAALMGWEDNKKSPPDIGMPVGELVELPIVASVAAGYNGLAVESFSGETMVVPAYLLRGYAASECRVFRVNGDSMYPQIINGDTVLVHLQSSVDSGDVAVIVYNSDEATLKRVRYVSGEDWLELVPANPEYQTKRIEGPELELCRVYGKVLSLIRDI